MLEVLIAESRGDQRPSERLSHRQASVVSVFGGSGVTAGDDVGPIITNRGQRASPEEFSITVGGRMYV